MMNRKKALEKLREKHFDLLIIGGGITGAGIALDAASRGLNVALIEMHDFASGTSSRSTKLIHGGLRYLKQFELKLVNEVGRERAIVHRLAPHLVHPDKMLLPLIEGGNYGYWLTSMGLTVYDFLAGVEGDDKRRMLSKEETLESEPLLRGDILEGSGLYAEYRTDDARLVIGVIKTAVEHGATVANYLRADSLNVSHERIKSVSVTDIRSLDRFEINARSIVNATGPWVDEIRQYDGKLSSRHLRLTKGVHLVVAHERLPVKSTIYFDNEDGRMIFAVPRGSTTYLGTTDTEYTGEKREPEVDLNDVTYILGAVNRMFPDVGLTPGDVESTWAGLRPLIHEEGKSASEVSRKDEMFVSKNGLISIAGGKLTGYRKMAERVVNKVYESRKIKFPTCKTDHIKISGGDFDNYSDVTALKAELEATFSTFFDRRTNADYLVNNYGTDSLEILNRAKSCGSPSVTNLLKAEIDYTIDHEMVESLADFFERRTGRVNFDINFVREHLEVALSVMAKKLEWDKEQIVKERDNMTSIIDRASGNLTWKAEWGAQA